MNRKLKKIITSLILVCMMAVISPWGHIVSFASDAKISFSDPSVMVGNDVTVNMKVTSDTALGTAEIMLSYDPGILEFVSGTSANGGAGAIKILGTMNSADQKSFQFTLKFKTLKAGNGKITVTSQEIYDVNSGAVTVSKQGSSTVKVTSPATYSKDATLKSLKISPGTLSPDFSSKVDSYTAEVDANTADLVVNAVASNAGAQVTLTGEKGLKAGENQVVVKVTAEDGQTIKNYTIKVTKPEGGETTPTANPGGETGEAEFSSASVTIHDIVYRIASSFDESTLPEGFEAANYQYKGTEVMAGKGLEKDILLLYLKDEGGNGGFFIYNEGADSWSQFVEVKTTEKAVVIIPLDGDAAVPEGFKEQQIEIDGIKVTGWVANTESKAEYCLFYGMNWNGEKNFYRYDLTEKTVQRYFATGVTNDKYVELAQTYSDLLKDYHLQFYILIAVSVLALALLVIVIFLIKRGGGPDLRPDKPLHDNHRKDEPKSRGESRAEAAPPVTVRRYSREEFKERERTGRLDSGFEDDIMDEPDTFIPKTTSYEEEDDFMEESSLEEMEQNLIPGGRAVNSRRNPKMNENEDDDFEFMDLDD
ncbi:cadherin-like beta sandwich domain-containing protein [Clostridium boliviensis]|uniref:Cadherin-like beta sandwich domain-containing protein n=1 Tax=Clostridium boliviensis TaxID=318465 RepID=A0ABU4GFG3_9CLOT|nr:cadherin-like beta sandwich domain-containing protein [Clostridium boliviensis]MDW2796306.1 cadherin-like beta sandwich domain-containing protein [Clostridium boliviensis]